MKKVLVILSFLIVFSGCAQVTTLEQQKKIDELQAQVTTKETALTSETEKATKQQSYIQELEGHIKTAKKKEPNLFESTLFDGCGDQAKYEKEPWFQGLKDMYNSKQFEPQSLTVKTGCLSLDKEWFVFIPQAQNTCGFILKFHTVQTKLTNAPKAPYYCADAFSKKDNNIIEFYGKNEGATYNGKYYFLEDKIEVSGKNS